MKSISWRNIWQDEKDYVKLERRIWLSRFWMGYGGFSSLYGGYTVERYDGQWIFILDRSSITDFVCHRFTEERYISKLLSRLGQFFVPVDPLVIENMFYIGRLVEVSRNNGPPLEAALSTNVWVDLHIVEAAGTANPIEQIIWKFFLNTATTLTEVAVFFEALQVDFVTDDTSVNNTLRDWDWAVEAKKKS